MKVMVTGHLGFVGSATMRALPDAVGYDIMEGHDIRDREQLAWFVGREKPDRILHLAAISRFADADADPVAAFSVNVQGTENVAEVAERYHIPLVYSSTGSVYMPVRRDPPITEDFPAAGNSVYGCTKYAGDLIVRRSSSPWIVLRYAHLYGAEKRMSGLIGNFLDRIRRGLQPMVYGGAQSSDFTYIDDVVRANLAALNASWENWNQVYNIGTGEELTTASAAQTICDVFGYGGGVETVERREVDADRFVFDCSKASARLGFTADHSFRSGLVQMREAMRAGG
jgi:nucleoside-diphosphate-sugar epimerase